MEPGPGGRPYSEGRPCSTPTSPRSLPATPHKYKKGDVVKDECIELPEEFAMTDKNLKLAIDILFVDRALFLVSID